MTRLLELGWSQNIPAAFYSTYLFLCSCQLWKHRHDVVFGGMEPSLIRLILCLKVEDHLWRCRLPHSDQITSQARCQSLSFNIWPFTYFCSVLWCCWKSCFHGRTRSSLKHNLVDPPLPVSLQETSSIGLIVWSYPTNRQYAYYIFMVLLVLLLPGYVAFNS